MISQGELGEIDHVCGDVNDRPEDDGPGSRLVEGDILVEGNVVVQRGAPDEGYEVAADGQQDEDDIYV